MTATKKARAIPTEAPPVVRDLQSYIGRLCATPVPIEDDALLVALEFQAKVTALVLEAFPAEPALQPWELRSLRAPRSYSMTPEQMAAFFICERARKAAR
jgi:hypothetical protein